MFTVSLDGLHRVLLSIGRLNYESVTSGCDVLVRQDSSRGIYNETRAKNVERMINRNAFHGVVWLELMPVMVSVMATTTGTRGRATGLDNYDGGQDLARCRSEHQRQAVSLAKCIIWLVTMALNRERHRCGGWGEAGLLYRLLPKKRVC
jgi:hypothetical protein